VIIKIVDIGGGASAEKVTAAFARAVVRSPTRLPRSRALAAPVEEIAMRAVVHTLINESSVGRCPERKPVAILPSSIGSIA
jgi:hypothetical protein